MPWIEDDLFYTLRDNGYIIEEKPQSIEEFFSKDRPWNVSLNDGYSGAQHKTQYKLNPFIGKFPLSLGFEDVAIQQEKNEVTSRSEVDISSEFCRGVKLKVPLVAANMSTVTNAQFCRDLHRYGALGVLHRAQNLAQYKREVFLAAAVYHPAKFMVAASVGVGYDQLSLAEELIKFGANIIVIDVAHGYADDVKLMARSIKRIDKNVKIVIGNTTNVNALEFFNDTVDAIKVGIAQGMACETKNTAGCTEKQFSAVLKFKDRAKELGMPIISDGGIREPADFVKAIAAGADTVMAGSIFARCPKSAAEVNEDGYKIYAGMASRYVQEKWHGEIKNGCPEGKVVLLPIGERCEDLLKRYAGALRSGITYAGANDIRSLHEKVKFVRI